MIIDNEKENDSDTIFFGKSYFLTDYSLQP